MKTTNHHSWFWVQQVLHMSSCCQIHDHINWYLISVSKTLLTTHRIWLGGIDEKWKLAEYETGESMTVTHAGLCSLSHVCLSTFKTEFYPLTEVTLTSGKSGLTNGICKLLDMNLLKNWITLFWNLIIEISSHSKTSLFIINFIWIYK